MTGRSHLVIGTVSASAGVALVGPSTADAAAVIYAAAAAATLPDWDKKLHIPHRGPTHTIIACLLVAGLVAFAMSKDHRSAPYALAAAVGVIVGYGMHLVADACTIRGVPAFSPLYRRDVHLLPEPMRMRTGKRAEQVLVPALALGSIYLIAHYVYGVV